jgi:hypothetical protein
MEGLHCQQVRQALRIIKAASSAADVSVLTGRVLDVLCESLCTDRGLFILPDEAGKFTDFRAETLRRSITGSSRTITINTTPSI